MKRYYLAARYSRIDELNKYKQDLEARGNKVTSRWLKGEHRAEDADLDPVFSADIALKDLLDVYEAGTIINFTEPPRQQNTTRGGRHVEFGVGLALRRHLVIIGPRENVFHYLPDVKQYDTWEQFLEVLDGRKDYVGASSVSTNP